MVVVIWLRTAPFKRCSCIIGAQTFTSLILHIIQGYVHSSCSFVGTLPLLIEWLFEGASLLGLALADSSSFGTLVVLRLGFQSIFVFDLSLLLLPFVLLLLSCASKGPGSPIGGWDLNLWVQPGLEFAEGVEFLLIFGIRKHVLSLLIFVLDLKQVVQITLIILSRYLVELIRLDSRWFGVNWRIRSRHYLLLDLIDVSLFMYIHLILLSYVVIGSRHQTF